MELDDYDPTATHDILDLMKWPEHCISKVVASFGIGSLKALAKITARTTYSTAFSGIDAPGTSLQMLAKTTQKMIDTLMPGSGLRVSAPNHVHATEKFKPAQGELQAHPSNPTCLFEDVEE
eukprot:4546407-Pyramimonas_sp.AAC.1